MKYFALKRIDLLAKMCYNINTVKHKNKKQVELKTTKTNREKEYIMNNTLINVINEKREEIENKMKEACRDALDNKHMQFTEQQSK